ncbi:MAG: hypothetical protein OEM81_04080 [Acidimicrobiia bacterium]|nr:hypothetical protein [Acidimicrobiia bacterium]MDH3396993.1 hypothetical protein [Acidimicrobiia bacterium]MDH5615853.1 hypothetical protein [Acidimicrobiia bacterium]
MNERHSLDIISLIFGVLFLGLAVPILLLDTPLNMDIRWALPATVIVIGLLILGSALLPKRTPVAELEERSG